MSFSAQVTSEESRIERENKPILTSTQQPSDQG